MIPTMVATNTPERFMLKPSLNVILIPPLTTIPIPITSISATTIILRNLVISTLEAAKVRRPIADIIP